MPCEVSSLYQGEAIRFAIGVGSSSNVIVERWNGIPFEEPYKKVRDVVRFLNDALGGEKVTKEYDTFKVDGFRLGIKPEVKPQILVAALREGMLRLAAREADGTIINWLSPEDVTRVAEVVHGAANGTPKEIVARIFVCPSTNTEAVRSMARFAIAAYLNVPVYADFHAWLGRGDLLKGMWDNWKAGDRKAALAAIPDEVVDALIISAAESEVTIDEACVADVINEQLGEAAAMRDLVQRFPPIGHFPRAQGVGQGRGVALMAHGDGCVDHMACGQVPGQSLGAKQHLTDLGRIDHTENSCYAFGSSLRNIFGG